MWNSLNIGFASKHIIIGEKNHSFLSVSTCEVNAPLDNHLNDSHASTSSKRRENVYL